MSLPTSFASACASALGAISGVLFRRPTSASAIVTAPVARPSAQATTPDAPIAAPALPVVEPTAPVAPTACFSSANDAGTLPAPRRTLTLSSARCGERLRVLGVAPHSPAAGRLKELGLCESLEVRKIADGAALICQVRDVRLAIGRNLGGDVLVEAI